MFTVPDFQDQVQLKFWSARKIFLYLLILISIIRSVAEQPHDGDGVGQQPPEFSANVSGLCRVIQLDGIQ